MSAQAPTQMAYRNVKVGPVTVFYREAGNPQHPTLLLLHGFPTRRTCSAISSRFRDLIPLVTDRYQVVAPDLPGFGFSTAPDRKAFCYSFDNLAKVIENFTDAVGLSRYAIYYSTTAPRSAFAWRCHAPSGSRPSSRRTAMPTRKGLVTDGRRSSFIGRSRHRPIVRRSARS